jgi:hypothetical protein
MYHVKRATVKFDYAHTVISWQPLKPGGDEVIVITFSSPGSRQVAVTDAFSDILGSGACHNTQGYGQILRIQLSIQVEYPQ